MFLKNLYFRSSLDYAKNILTKTKRAISKYKSEILFKKNENILGEHFSLSWRGQKPMFI